MKPRELMLYRKVTAPVDMSQITEQVVRNHSTNEVENMLISVGREFHFVGDLFRVSGVRSKHLMIANSCNKLNRIGQGWANGFVSVIGDAGDFAGHSLRGATLEVSGSVGAYAGCGMKGGTINILGNAGDWLAAPLSGAKLGMNDGYIFVQRNAGSRAGHRMRRGVIVVNGNVGDGACSSMIGGTAVLLGDSPQFPGTHMRRGTIVCNINPRLAHASFFEQETRHLAFFSLLKSVIVKKECGVDLNRFPDLPLRRFVGDRNVQGMGEVLVI